MENCKTIRKSVWLNTLTLLIAGAVLMTAPISAWAKHLGGSSGHTPAAYSTVPAEDVRNTLHNLSTSNTFTNPNIASGATFSTNEVCVFCHTPHGADVSNQAAPLWNRALPASSSYSNYDSANFDGDTSTGPRGVSLACLSCHDGTTALDAFINGPGSGRYFSANTLTSTAATTNFVALSAGFGATEADGSMGDGSRTDNNPNYGAILGGAKPFPNLTEQLSDDHPISFVFQAAVNGDPQFDDVVAATGGAAGNITVLTNTASGKTNAPVDRRDRLRLYPPTGGANVLGNKQDWVECASCHNPHAPRPLFLRLPLGAAAYSVKGGGSVTVGEVLGTGAGGGLIADNPNSGSAVCLSCHEK